ncbi:MAG: S8 family serine peptidase [Chloroflexi bacterium]|nr:S8 family serine peptidase [Chloroflexota bacterium]
MRKTFLSLAACAFLALAFTFAGPNASAQKQRHAPIRLQAGTFTPTLGETLNNENTPQAEGEANGSGYYLVQFNGPVRAQWKQALTDAGAEIVAYVPDFAFKVRMSASQARTASSLQNVAWVGAFLPAYKSSPTLQRGALAAYTVRVERGADVQATIAAISAAGAQVVNFEEDILRVAATAAQVDAIARVSAVAWIENYVLPEKHNEYGGGVILGANIANANGYDGSTQIAAVADTGLGDGTKAGAHPDIPASRIVKINNWPGKTDICFTKIFNDGPIDADSGHGTHTSGSVLSNGGASGEGKGVAPAAQLVFQATENYAQVNALCLPPGTPTQGYYLTGLPDKLQNLFAQAYKQGARIHSNSWGAAVSGDYNANSAEVDDYAWKKKDLTITFSSGNSGTDANKNGIVDFGSVGAPATAKNVITVGASENDRQGHWECDTSLTYQSHDLYQTGETCSSMGGQNLLGTYGQRYPDSFPVNPLKNDVTAGNQEQMAAWSSRGPVDDGRIKPDLVAPGTWLLSASQNLYQEGYGDPKNPRLKEYAWDGWGMPRNEFYKYMGGTSMSNPLVAGAATVVRDYYQKAHGINATSALVKATLINSAVDMLDENNDGVNDDKYPIPNNHEGWGRVNVADATDGTRQFVEEKPGVETKKKRNYQYTLPGGQPFKVTLVWTDYPSTEAAARNLVNDLDLLVVSPSGAKYKGNVFAHGWGKTGGKFDAINNVENVYVQSAEAGTWTVRVRGANVPYGPQPFALVVQGP